MQALVALVVVLLASACSTLPQDAPANTPSFGSEPLERGVLAEVSRKVRATGDGEEVSGFRVLDRNDDSFLWRLALVDSAEQSLDAQYFIWHDDATGLLLLDRILAAADRGVRVRLLVDDLMMDGGDRTVAALSAHPNVEIRIFNPWAVRSGGGEAGRGVEFAVRMKQLNHRMHNKLLVADNQLGIVGGRNIGDEYFGLSERFNFIDLDLLAAGPVVAEVTRAFDVYWNTEDAHSGEALGQELPEGALAEARGEIQGDLAQYTALLVSFPLERRDWRVELASLADEMHVAPAHVTVDHPPAEGQLPVQVYETLAEFTDDAREDLFVASAYFIPGQESIDWIADATSRGVRVRVLTNSLASNDVSVSNSGYKTVRRPVLEAGAELYELREDPEIAPEIETPPVRADYVAFHTKALVFDRSKVYVGSLNLDPRSIYLNTELGLLIEHEGLADEIQTIFERLVEPANGWQVLLEDGALSWSSSKGVVHRQPARGGWQRVEDGFFSLLPLKSQL